ncbi:hypothetical protein [Sporofaciens sp. JLR.KK001]
MEEDDHLNSPDAQVKKRSPLRLRFLTCSFEAASCAICISYFASIL